MKRSALSATVSLLLSLLVVLVCTSAAQTVPPLDKIQNQADLDKAVAALDTALFDSYNHCDLVKFESFFVDDVEFYHDQGGLTLGKAALTDAIKKNICGKVTRELLPLASARIGYTVVQERAQESFDSHRCWRRQSWIQGCPHHRRRRSQIRGRQIPRVLS